MEITKIDVAGYEQVVKAVDQSIDFRAIISIHDTTLGPALGGLRLWDYNTEEEALQDVLRLSEGMTYKAACAGLELGGGKSVIMGKNRTEEIFLAMGELVESLGGKYITAEDVGTTVDNMQIIRKKTKYVTGLPLEDGSSGDPSPSTALGVFEGTKACMEEMFNHADFSKVTVAIQGVGHVGKILVDHFHKAGARLVITDINEKLLEEVSQQYPVEVVKLDEIYGVDCDIFCPCALGAVINDDTIGQLKSKIVSGSANNQLLREEHGDKLREKGILYAPDYVVNAGGLINVYMELLPGGYDKDKAQKRVKHIYQAIKDIINLAKEKHVTTAVAAHHFALDLINKVRKEKGVELRQYR